MRAGSIVKYAHPQNGYVADQELAAEHLTVGQEYEVAEVEVHSWHTNVFLKDFPGVRFNDVCFETVRE